MDRRKLSMMASKDPRYRSYAIRSIFTILGLYVLLVILGIYSSSNAALVCLGISFIYSIYAISKMVRIRKEVEQSILKKLAKEQEAARIEAEIAREARPRQQSNDSYTRRQPSRSYESSSSTSSRERSQAVADAVEKVASNPAVKVATSYALGAAATKALQKPMESLIPPKNPNTERYKQAHEKARQHQQEMNEARKPKEERIGHYIVKTMPNGDQKLIFGNRMVGRYDKARNETYKEGSFKPIAKGNALSSLMK